MSYICYIIFRMTICLYSIYAVFTAGRPSHYLRVPTNAEYSILSIGQLFSAAKHKSEFA